MIGSNRQVTLALFRQPIEEDLIAKDGVEGIAVGHLELPPDNKRMRPAAALPLLA